jgi:hypothetical protein
LKPGQSLGYYAPYLPAGDRALGSYRVVVADPGEGLSRTQATAQLLRDKPDYVLLTESQRRWGELVRGWPSGWLSEVEQSLRAAGYQQVPTAASVSLLRAPAAR